MIAGAALGELARWQPPTAAQSVLKQDFVAHLHENTDGWSRACRPDHLTASALVVDASRTRVLLCLHRKVGLWLQFGGHIEAEDQSVAEAALREAREESGIDGVALVDGGPLRLDRHAAPCDSRARHHLDVQYLAAVPDGAQPRTSSESLDVRWFRADGLPDATDDAVRQLVRAACRDR